MTETMTITKPFIPMSTRVSVALHNANAYARTGDAHYQHTMVDVIEGSEYPHLTLAEVARRLGRNRALAVEIDSSVIDYSISLPKILHGRL